MPAGRPAFKQNKGVTREKTVTNYRFWQPLDNFILLLRFEVDYEGITYTTDTPVWVYKVYPSNVEFFFITRADALVWYCRLVDGQTVAELAHFVAATRPGYELSSKGYCRLHYDFKVTYLEVPALAISLATA